MQHLKFDKQRNADFERTLRRRVDDYFSSRQLSRRGDGRLYLKTLCMLGLHLGPFIIILTRPLPLWAVLGLYACMGLGVAGIGMGVMHDAVHEAYSSSRRLNRWLAFSMELIGGTSFNWKVQHNVLHHTYTNVAGYDEDIADKSIMRLEPSAPWQDLHRLQHWYALPLYSLLTLNWLLVGDYLQLRRYIDAGFAEKYGLGRRKQLALFLSAKTTYVFVHIALPLAIAGVPASHVLLGFALMHLIAGFVLSLVFQLAHIVEHAAYPKPDAEHRLASNWFVHQLETTANFATRSGLVTWFVGGLNFQIEHHLFPRVSHVHYPELANIVRRTAAEFRLPYHEYGTVGAAVASHLRRLKILGQNAALAR